MILLSLYRADVFQISLSLGMCTAKQKEILTMHCFSIGGRHKDGSVRLWLMFYDGITTVRIANSVMCNDVCIDVLYCVYFTDKSPSSVASFELALVVYTAEYYEIPQGQQINVSVLLCLAILSLYIDVLITPAGRS